MTTEQRWEDEVEATDLELIAALEADILATKALLTSLSTDEELVF